MAPIEIVYTHGEDRRQRVELRGAADRALIRALRRDVDHFRFITSSAEFGR